MLAEVGTEVVSKTLTDLLIMRIRAIVMVQGLTDLVVSELIDGAVGIRMQYYIKI